MSYGLTCEQPGCRCYATKRTSRDYTAIKFYCDQHAPRDGEPMVAIQNRDHENYGDNDGARRELLRARRKAGMLLSAAAMFGGVDLSIRDRPIQQTKAGQEAIAKAEAKRARRAARLRRDMGGEP